MSRKSKVFLTITIAILLISSFVIYTIKSDKNTEENKVDESPSVVDNFDHNYDPLVESLFNESVYVLFVNTYDLTRLDSSTVLVTPIQTEFYENLKNNYPEIWSKLLEFEKEKKYGCSIFYTISDNRFKIPNNCIKDIYEIEFENSIKWVYEKNDKIFISDANIDLTNEKLVYESEEEGLSLFASLDKTKFWARFHIYGEAVPGCVGGSIAQTLVYLEPTAALDNKDPVLVTYNLKLLADKLEKEYKLDQDKFSSIKEKHVFGQMSNWYFQTSRISSYGVTNDNYILVYYRSFHSKIIWWNPETNDYKIIKEGNNLTGYLDNMDKSLFDVDGFLVDYRDFEFYPVKNLKNLILIADNNSNEIYLLDITTVDNELQRINVNLNKFEEYLEGSYIIFYDYKTKEVKIKNSSEEALLYKLED